MNDPTITITSDTLSDGSVVHDLKIRQDRDLIVLPCVTLQDAERLLVLLTEGIARHTTVQAISR